MSIYLDNAATTKLRQEVINAMMPYFTDKWHNPSALYSEANKVKKDVENARKICADFINAENNEIFFTSGGSEGNSWVIQGFINYWISQGIKPSIITSSIEHKSILSCVKNLSNADVYYLQVNSSGLVDIKILDELLFNVAFEYGCPTLVSIQFANNEIGTIQYIEDISKLVHSYGAIFHTDAVQAFGKISIDVKELNIDIMTVSGHKIGAPKGVGFLYKKNNVEINPLIYGSQMNNMRGGTENVPYIIGIAKAIELLKKEMQNNYIETFNTRGYMFEKLDKLGCKFNGNMFHGLPNVISATFPQNISGESLIYMLDMSDVCVSAGSACNSRSIEPSYVLKAIGLTDDEAMRTIRITLSSDTTKEEIDYTVNEIEKAIKLLILDN